MISFQLEGLNILFTDDPTVDDKIKEDCVPGSPHITFYYQPGVEIELINPQPSSGFFTTKLTILEGDNSLKIARRLAKYYKQIKGWLHFLFHYQTIQIINWISNLMLFRCQTSCIMAVWRYFAGSKKDSQLGRYTKRKNLYRRKSRLSCWCQQAECRCRR